MKRSDAIKDLASELILTFIDLKVRPPNWDVAQSIAERLLNKAEEELGMLPPYDATSDDEDPIYGWESEDEETE